VKNKFTYWILNYVHSQFLEERLNVAILFYFPNENSFVFRYPKKFKRLKETYNLFQEWQLKASLTAIENKINILNSETNSLFYERPLEILLNKVLKEDATSLVFSQPKDTISFDDNINDSIEKYYNLYFSDYKADFKRTKHDEEYLLRTFKSRLLEKDEKFQNYLKRDIQIKSPKTTVKFEYEWHNGLANLVKPISFDLEEDNSINHKAILLYGQLNFIKDTLSEKKYNIDLLISGPSDNNSHLNSAYQNAIDIISSVGVKKNIVQENDLDKYITHVSAEIHAPIF